MLCPLHFIINACNKYVTLALIVINENDDPWSFFNLSCMNGDILDYFFLWTWITIGLIEFIEVFNKKEKKKFLKKINKKQKKKKSCLKLKCDNLNMTTKTSFNSLNCSRFQIYIYIYNSCNYSHECDRLLPPKHFCMIEKPGKGKGNKAK